MRTRYLLTKEMSSTADGPTSLQCFTIDVINVYNVHKKSL